MSYSLLLGGFQPDLGGRKSFEFASMERKVKPHLEVSWADAPRHDLAELIRSRLQPGRRAGQLSQPPRPPPATIDAS